MSGYWHDFVGMNQRRNYIKRNLYKAALVVLLLGALPISSASSIGGYFIPGGMYGGESGYYYWEDYCPLCDHYGCLLVNPKGTYEGEVTCSACDADYDGCTGYDKSAYGARAKLIPAIKEATEPVNVTAQSTEQNESEVNNTTSNFNDKVELDKLPSKSLVPVSDHHETTIAVNLGINDVLVNSTVLQAHLKKINEHGLV